MRLANVAEGIGEVIGNSEARVTSVTHDSRQVGTGSLFVALKGRVHDGHTFLAEAVARGAAALAVEQVEAAPAVVPRLLVPDARRALAKLAARVYGDPSRCLRVVGVTGTNGKTTTTFLIRTLLESSGQPCGLIGTLAVVVGEETRSSSQTTPEASDVQRLLREMVNRGLCDVVMEVSSHALHFGRVDEVAFDVAVFTNQTTSTFTPPWIATCRPS